MPYRAGKRYGIDTGAWEPEKIYFFRICNYISIIIGFYSLSPIRCTFAVINFINIIIMNNKPLTLGITGHRDLREEDREILRQSVRQIFQFLRQHYPNTPLQLLSPLAEGADSLVAQVALEENLQLIAPLPLPLKLYEIDFDTPESKQTLTELLEKAQVFELPLLDSEQNISSYGDPRNKQYALVGAYVARHSQILLALWDGLPSEKSAGTAQVVKFKLTGDMKDLPKDYQTPPLEVPDTGPVCHIVTGRKSGEPLEAVGEIRVLLPNDDEVKGLDDLLRRPR